MDNSALILLDLDRKWTKCGWVRWSQRCAAALHLLDIKPEGVKVSQTRRGFHVTIIAPKRFTPLQLVAIQAILGSDSLRECMNLRRAIEDAPGHWNVLFHHKMTINPDGTFTFHTVKHHPVFNIILNRAIERKFQLPTVPAGARLKVQTLP